jgi:hypothetical protein
VHKNLQQGRFQLEAVSLLVAFYLSRNRLTLEILDNGVCLLQVTNVTEFKNISLLRFLFARVSLEEARNEIVLKYNKVKHKALVLENKMQGVSNTIAVKNPTLHMQLTNTKFGKKKRVMY